MEYQYLLENKTKVSVLKKIILCYLEQYMVYHLDQKSELGLSLKGLIEDRKLKSLFRVLSRSLLLNVEQFIKSKKWMCHGNGSSIKNITITSLNIIPEEDEDKLSTIGSVHSEYNLKQVTSSESTIITSDIIIPTETTNICEYNVEEDKKRSFEAVEIHEMRNKHADLDNLLPGLILGRLNFISLSLLNINKILEISKSQAESSSIT